MAYKYLDRAWMTTASTGTGSITLGSAKAGFLTFGEAGLANGDTCTYLIREGNDFEMGVGTYTASGTVLSRDTVVKSKISGVLGTSKMVLAGAAEVFSAQPSSEMLIQAITTAILLGTIDLGHASDTTIARAAAGVVSVEGINLLLAGKSDTISKGFLLSPAALGTLTSFTVDASLGNYQYGTNNGAITITAPAIDCAVDILIINGATPGAISFSGFKTPGTGASGATYATTATTWWVLSIRRINGVSTFTWNGPWT